jgi:hypothetical protein
MACHFDRREKSLKRYSQEPCLRILRTVTSCQELPGVPSEQRDRSPRPFYLT